MTQRETTQFLSRLNEIVEKSRLRRDKKIETPTGQDTGEPSCAEFERGDFKKRRAAGGH